MKLIWFPFLGLHVIFLVWCGTTQTPIMRKWMVITACRSYLSKTFTQWQMNPACAKNSNNKIWFSARNVSRQRWFLYNSISPHLGLIVGSGSSMKTSSEYWRAQRFCFRFSWSFCCSCFSCWRIAWQGSKCSTGHIQHVCGIQASLLFSLDAFHFSQTGKGLSGWILSWILSQTMSEKPKNSIHTYPSLRWITDNMLFDSSND